MKAGQYPIPGMEGAVRFGRTAAAQVRDRTGLPCRPGRGPLTWTTTVDPADIIVHIWVPGQLKTKARTRSAIRYKKNGEPYLSVYPDRDSETFEQQMAMLLKLNRRMGPCGGRIGLRLIVLLPPHRGHAKDWDNIGKLISDAGNKILYDDDAQVELPSMDVRRGVRPGRAGVDILVWRATPPTLKPAIVTPTPEEEP